MIYRNKCNRIVPVFLFILCSSCATIGPQKVVSSHTAYNDAVQLTVVREVLANIVRSRYSDPMQFIAVSAINAQFSVNAGGGANIGGIGAAGTAGGLDTSIGYSDSPTITFVPQSDAGFYKSFYEPFDVGETIGFGLSYRYANMDKGWQNLSMRYSFASINGASDYVNGQINDVYEKRIAALEYLLDNNASFQQVPDWDYDSIAIATDKITAEDKIEAFKWGLFFIEEGEGDTVRLARYRLVLAIIIPRSNDPKTRLALESLGVDPGYSRYVFRPPLHASPGELSTADIWVTTRSMADVINLATQFVDIPVDHEDIVQPLVPRATESVRFPAITIHSSKEEPAFPYRIKHRGYWFYVDDTELASKMFLEALVAAYSSRVGSKQAGDEAPQVVLPVGG
jgi:hypothetical protein